MLHERAYDFSLSKQATKVLSNLQKNAYNDKNCENAYSFTRQTIEFANYMLVQGNRRGIEYDKNEEKT